MAKSIIYESDAKTKILHGVQKLEKTVSVTLGPCGKNVIIDEFGQIHSTRDGVTVAKAVELKDKFENLGANAIKEVAEKSADMVGDGTTTSTVLAASIYANGLKYVSLGSNATQVKNGIKMAADEAVKFVEANAIKISSRDDIKRVAVVSANGDQKIGDMLADMLEKIGNDGMIKVENSNGLDLTSKVVEGMVIEKSYVSPYMVTNPERMEAELENPWILVVDDKISNFKQLMPCIQTVQQTGCPLLIIAESYSEDVLATMIVNKMRGVINSVLIESPSFGDNRRSILNDIAVLCGGRVVTEATGTRLDHAVPGSGILGQAKKVVITKQNTVIMGGMGNKVEIDELSENLRVQIANATDSFDKECLQGRLAKLTSGIGIISVGASTEAERKELRDRVDDAFCAAKAALRKGVVAGGGSALLMTKRHIVEWMKNQNFTEDEMIGVKIFGDSLQAPIRKILENAGMDSSLIVDTILGNTTSKNFGFNVLKKEYVDMVEDGIIDPAEVVINEIQNSSSVASLLLVTEALIVEEPKEQSTTKSIQ